MQSYHSEDLEGDSMPLEKHNFSILINKVVQASFSAKKGQILSQNWSNSALGSRSIDIAAQKYKHFDSESPPLSVYEGSNRNSYEEVHKSVPELNKNSCATYQDRVHCGEFLEKDIVAACRHESRTRKIIIFPNIERNYEKKSVVGVFSWLRFSFHFLRTLQKSVQIEIKWL